VSDATQASDGVEVRGTGADRARDLAGAQRPPYPPAQRRGERVPVRGAKRQPPGEALRTARGGAAGAQLRGGLVDHSLSPPVRGRRVWGRQGRVRCQGRAQWGVTCRRHGPLPTA
jgi:hypothetical protein